MQLAKCHPTRKLKCRGMCGPCYSRWLKDHNPPCKTNNCNFPMHARGICRNCYDKWLKTTNKTYRERQLANRKHWEEENPDKYKEYLEKERIRNKERSKNPEYKRQRRNRQLKRNYGITIDQYEQLLLDQGDGCSICGRKAGKIALHVDHNHETGTVRGILCHQCNWYMGTIDKDPKILDKIRKYRERTRST